MVCLLDMEGDEIKGWPFGLDTHGLRRQMQARPWEDNRFEKLSEELLAMKVAAPGKYRLSTGHILLVE
jgi:hypothetical protein